MPRTMPWSEISHLTIIPIIGKPQFRSDEKNPTIVRYDPTVVMNVSVTYRHPHVKQNSLTIVMVEDPLEHLP